MVKSAPYVRLNHVSLSLNNCYAIISYVVSFKLPEMWKKKFLNSRLANNYYENLKRIKGLNSNNETTCRKTFLHEWTLFKRITRHMWLFIKRNTFIWLVIKHRYLLWLVLWKSNKVYNLRLSSLWCFDTSFKRTICNHSLCAKATMRYLDRSGSSHCL